jgi:type I restriction enzyme S subunit
MAKYDKYDKYDKYKDSGVEWLGEIPSHWDVKRLGSFFEERREKVSDVDYPALSVTKSGIVPQLDTAAKTDAGDNRKLVKADDFVINSRSDRKGSSGISPYTGSVSLISIVMEPRTIYPAYAHHLLRSYPFQEEFYRYGKGIVADLWSTNSSEMKNILLPVIPITEQQNIANFLDHETAKIDSLIEKQQQLIQLLKEKRQAVISHAVTKGLDPNVPMKDSGVEWLGQVPEHWKICSLSKIFSIKAGGDVQTRLFSEIQTDEHKFPIYTNANNANSIYGYSKIANYSANSITVSGRGDVGFAVYRDHAFDAIIRLLVLTPQKTCYTKYFAYFINEVIDFKVESSAIGQLSTLQISPYKILFPPFDEQKLITEYLDNETIKIDALIHKAESVIQLMQERRTVLISSAVTGKIDVRNWQNPTEAKMEFSA